MLCHSTGDDPVLQPQCVSMYPPEVGPSLGFLRHVWHHHPQAVQVLQQNQSTVIFLPSPSFHFVFHLACLLLFQSPFLYFSLPLPTLSNFPSLLSCFLSSLLLDLLYLLFFPYSPSFPPVSSPFLSSPQIQVSLPPPPMSSQPLSSWSPLLS